MGVARNRLQEIVIVKVTEIGPAPGKPATDGSIHFRFIHGGNQVFGPGEPRLRISIARRKTFISLTEGITALDDLLRKDVGVGVNDHRGL